MKIYYKFKHLQIKFAKNFSKKKIKKFFYSNSLEGKLKLLNIPDN